MKFLKESAATQPKHVQISTYPQEIPARYQQFIPKKFSCCSAFFLRLGLRVGHPLFVAAVLSNQCDAAEAPRDPRGWNRGSSDLPTISTGSGAVRRLLLTFGCAGIPRSNPGRCRRIWVSALSVAKASPDVAAAVSCEGCRTSWGLQNAQGSLGPVQGRRTTFRGWMQLGRRPLGAEHPV